MPYFDHAATSPMRREAIEAVTTCFGLVGNPSSVHAAGRAARKVVEEAREQVAAALGAHSSEVLFTGGGTEADNLALKGMYWARQAADTNRRRILIGPLEHPAVRNSAAWLAETQGALVEELSADEQGRVLPQALRAALGRADDVALVSVMWANNEIGSVSPIAQLSAVAAECDVPMHSDAVQAVGHLPVDFAASGVAALSVAAHKVGGPLGAGALLLRREAALRPVLHGGGQERELRSGTLNASGAAGFAAAVTAAVADLAIEASRLRALRDHLVERVRQAVPDVVLHGPPLDGDRLPGNASLSFPGCAGDMLLMLLDGHDIACSAGSACSAGVLRPSRVLLALGVPEDLALGTLRFSLGHTTTAADVELVGDVIGSVVDAARRVGVPVAAS